MVLKLMKINMETCFIRKNTPELRNKLKDIGYKICICCEFEDNKWLHTFIHENRIEVHGIGLWDEMCPFSKDDVFNYFLYENTQKKKPDIDCQENEEKFLSIAKNTMNKFINK